LLCFDVHDSHYVFDQVAPGFNKIGVLGQGGCLLEAETEELPQRGAALCPLLCGHGQRSPSLLPMGLEEVRQYKTVLFVYLMSFLPMPMPEFSAGILGSISLAIIQGITSQYKTEVE
jgi:hypothetical protein